MKVKRYRLHGCLLLICAIGLAVSIGTSVANSKIPLSDDAMSSVYGGECGPCDDMSTQGCHGQSEYNCTDEDCGGWYREGCRQDEKECKGTSPSTSCTTLTVDCEGTWTQYECNYYSLQCNKDEDYTKSCDVRQKDWCE